MQNFDYKYNGQPRGLCRLISDKPKCIIEDVVLRDYRTSYLRCFEMTINLPIGYGKTVNRVKKQLFIAASPDEALRRARAARVEILSWREVNKQEKELETADHAAQWITEDEY